MPAMRDGDICTLVDLENANANARVIAAAPDMLAALRAVWDAGAIPGKRGKEARLAAERLVGAAIAKAVQS